MAGNPEQLKKVSVGTRFKKGNKEGTKHTGNHWSYRQQLEWVKNQDLDALDLDGAIKKLLLLRAHKGKAPINATRMVAIRMLERVIKKMEPALAIALIEQTEGKLPQVEIQGNLEDMPVPTDFVSDEEAARIWQSTRAKQ